MVGGLEQRKEMISGKRMAGQGDITDSRQGQGNSTAIGRRERDMFSGPQARSIDRLGCLSLTVSLRLSHRPQGLSSRISLSSSESSPLSLGEDFSSASVAAVLDRLAGIVPTRTATTASQRTRGKERLAHRHWTLPITAIDHWNSLGNRSLGFHRQHTMTCFEQ